MARTAWLVALACLLGGCSGPAASDDAAGGDASADAPAPLNASEQPLVGTWASTVDGAQGATTVFTEEFRADRTATVTVVYSTAQCPMQRTAVVQQTWSASGGALAVMPAPGCMMTDSTCTGPTPPNLCEGLTAVGSYQFALDGGTLVLMPTSAVLGGTYMRQ